MWIIGGLNGGCGNDTQQAIRDAGYVPQLRNQEYDYRELPPHTEQQELNEVGLVVD